MNRNSKEINLTDIIANLEIQENKANPQTPGQNPLKRSADFEDTDIRPFQPTKKPKTENTEKEPNELNTVPFHPNTDLDTLDVRDHELEPSLSFQRFSTLQVDNLPNNADLEVLEQLIESWNQFNQLKQEETALEKNEGNAIIEGINEKIKKLHPFHLPILCKTSTSLSKEESDYYKSLTEFVYTLSKKNRELYHLPNNSELKEFYRIYLDQVFSYTGFLCKLEAYLTQSLNLKAVAESSFNPELMAHLTQGFLNNTNRMITDFNNLWDEKTHEFGRKRKAFWAHGLPFLKEFSGLFTPNSVDKVLDQIEEEYTDLTHCAEIVFCELYTTVQDFKFVKRESTFQINNEQYKYEHMLNPERGALQKEFRADLLELKKDAVELKKYILQMKLKKSDESYHSTQQQYRQDVSVTLSDLQKEFTKYYKGMQVSQDLRDAYQKELNIIETQYSAGESDLNILNQNILKLEKTLDSYIPNTYSTKTLVEKHSHQTVLLSGLMEEAKDITQTLENPPIHVRALQEDYPQHLKKLDAKITSLKKIKDTHKGKKDVEDLKYKYQKDLTALYDLIKDHFEKLKDELKDTENSIETCFEKLQKGPKKGRKADRPLAEKAIDIIKDLQNTLGTQRNTFQKFTPIAIAPSTIQPPSSTSTFFKSEDGYLPIGDSESENEEPKIITTKSFKSSRG